MTSRTPSSWSWLAYRTKPRKRSFQLNMRAAASLRPNASSVVRNESMRRATCMSVMWAIPKSSQSARA